MSHEHSSERHEEDRHHGHEPDHHGHHTLHLVIIVNGVPARVEVPAQDTLLLAAERALRETHNTGRPISDWEIKLGDRVLPFEERIDRLGLQNGAELFLSLKAGVGGLQ